VTCCVELIVRCQSYFYQLQGRLSPDKPPTLPDMAKHAHVEEAQLMRAVADITNALDMHKCGADAGLSLQHAPGL